MIYFGYRPSLPVCPQRRLPLVDTVQAQSLPPYVDLRPQCPPVLDQGAEGACVANDVAWALLFQQMAQGLPNPLPSRQFIYYNARALEGNIYVDSGCSVSDAVKCVEQFGYPPEYEWPYDGDHFTAKPTADVYADAAPFASTVAASVPQDLATMKGCLAGGKPFIFMAVLYQSYLTAGITGDIPLPGASEGIISAHTMVAIGYDDSKQVFRLVNSKGPNWGQNGFGTIPYAYLTNIYLSGDFLSIQRVPDIPITPPPSPPPPPSGPPTVVSMSPMTGPAGTLVRIIGTNFTQQAQVRFGLAWSGQVEVESDKALYAVAPAQTAKYAAVRVFTLKGGSAASGASLFTYST